MKSSIIKFIFNQKIYAEKFIIASIETIPQYHYNKDLSFSVFVNTFTVAVAYTNNLS